MVLICLEPIQVEEPAVCNAWPLQHWSYGYPPNNRALCSLASTKSYRGL